MAKKNTHKRKIIKSRKLFNKRVKSKKITKVINKTFDKFKKTKLFKVLYANRKLIANMLLLSIPFLVLDFSTRLFFLTKGKDVFYFVSILFNITWCFLFVGVSIFTKRKIGKFLYWIFLGLAFGIYLLHGIYYSLTNSFFDFSLVEMASEGSEYIWDTIKNAHVAVYITFILTLIGSIVLFKYRFPKEEKTNKNFLLRTIIIFVIIHTLLPLCYGKANTELTWNTWKNKRNIYINFNDDIQGMKITGLYEYTFRNFYITYLKRKVTNDEKEIAFLETVYTEENDSTHTNSYTGMLKDKNLIFLQLEGIDNWVITKDGTPNLYNLMNSSINFKKHYSYYNGGGSTFNSEFAINTGFITPLSYTRNAYTFNKNAFTYSMPNLFKKEGYTVNAFHMNTSQYYSRGINYNNWGYHHYYGLKDLDEYSDNSYNLDTELINNETFYNLMFKDQNKFVHYIITYSLHTPFINTKGVCKQIIDRDSLDIGTNTVATSEDTVILSEEECVRIQAKETDDMVGLLIQALKDNDLYDNTVIVAYADHYLYTLTDSSILPKYKTTENNLINNTPLFIWSSNIKKSNVNKVTSQLNILPTVLNLFGIEHNDNYYIGEDALDDDYNGLVFFSDFSWYDGNNYITNDDDLTDKEKLQEINSYVNYLIKKNDLTLKYDYFKTIKALTN